MPASTPTESFAFRVGRLLAQDDVEVWPLTHGVEYRVYFFDPNRGEYVLKPEELRDQVFAMLKPYQEIRELHRSEASLT